MLTEIDYMTSEIRGPFINISNDDEKDTKTKVMDDFYMGDLDEGRTYFAVAESVYTVIDVPRIASSNIKLMARVSLVEMSISEFNLLLIAYT